MGVERVVLSRVFNHADPSVTALYDRYGYNKEKCTIAASSPNPSPVRRI
jgi:hypothetical protein